MRPGVLVVTFREAFDQILEDVPHVGATDFVCTHVAFIGVEILDDLKQLAVFG